MKDTAQKQVAEAITRGESPRDVVRRFLDHDKTWKHKPDNGTVSYLRPLETWKQKIKRRMPEITAVSPDDAERIRKVMDVLKELLGKTQTDADQAKQPAPKAKPRQAMDERKDGTDSLENPGAVAVDGRKRGRKSVVGGAGSRQVRHG